MVDKIIDTMFLVILGIVFIGFLICVVKILFIYVRYELDLFELHDYNLWSYLKDKYLS